MCVFVIANGNQYQNRGKVYFPEIGGAGDENTPRFYGSGGGAGVALWRMSITERESRSKLLIFD